MAKVALLIGVGEYQSPDFATLAAVQADVAAMRDVLLDPDVGGFAVADVMTLLNPEPQRMREAMEYLFAGRRADDLLVLYFSGHGVVDDFNRFHLTTARVQKDLLNSTAIAASFVHGLMEGSRSKQQVVILDCCHSGAFAKGMSAKGGAVNLQSQLGGQGRAVLTSSSATEYSFEQKNAELSIYTQYLVEGVRTGIADRDGDGWIAVDELHEFAGAKVQEVAPAMQPKIYAAAEGYKIILAKAPVGDPKLEYRKEVEKLAAQKQGRFSQPILMALEVQQKKWGLDENVAAVIRQEVLRPYEEFAAKLRKYQHALRGELRQGNQLTQESYEDLQYLQQALGLEDENVRPHIQNVRILPATREAFPVAETIAEPIIAKPARATSLKDSDSGGRQSGAKELVRSRNVATSSNAKPRARVAVMDRPRSKGNAVPLRKNRKQWLIVSGVIGTLLLLLGSLQFINPNSQRKPTPRPSVIESPSPTSNNAKTSKLSAEELFKSGWEKEEKKDYKGTIADYDNAIKLKPDYAEAYNNRGNARSALGDHQAAIGDYDKAIQLKPDYAEAYNNRGNARSVLGDHQAAIGDYDKAMQLKPDYAVFYNNRGIARRDLGDHQGAITDYDKAIKLKPDYADAYYNRGIVRRDLGDNQGAITDYEQAAKLYKSQGKTQDYQDALNQIKKLQK